MAYIHGHAACINNSCAMFGLNQAECCSGENINNCVGTQQNEIALSPQRLQSIYREYLWKLKTKQLSLFLQ